MCHNGLNDQDGLDVSIETDWSSTMMANSTRDPFWRAKVRSELNRNPQQLNYTLLRSAKYLKDNRLLPQGFNKATAPDDDRVAGEALTDANLTGGSDESSYRINGLRNGAYQVEAGLLHQPIAYAFAQDLFAEVDAEVEDFKRSGLQLR